MLSGYVPKFETPQIRAREHAHTHFLMKWVEKKSVKSFSLHAFCPNKWHRLLADEIRKRSKVLPAPTLRLIDKARS